MLETFEDGRDRLSMTFRDLPGPWIFHVRAEIISGRPVLTGLGIEPRDEAAPAPLNRNALNKLPIAALNERVKSVLRADSDSLRVERGTGTDRKPGKVGRSWPDDHYLQVAWYYTLAQRVGDPPRFAVAREWRVSEVTASRWVAKSRKLGYLDAYDWSASRRGVQERDYQSVTRRVEESIIGNRLHGLLAHSEQGVRVATRVINAVRGSSAGVTAIRRDLFEQRLLELTGDADEDVALASVTLALELKNRGRLAAAGAD
ncbi:hypothetical protein F4553_005270 [Allocatelliglobosispora scoriae]|uniref:Uncharacterized protein n=1 Tax=Allocatelliglobosispora scoriae TaxID=643052 RepID=A0A841BYZ7_9ACTN|nr:hypothetical protein [Allocatelliglobosispora scoriae]MBB5871891.1 hypothetical protein [Allocatelliglobosispora scoriae]